MKKSFTLLLAVAFLLAGCAKENGTPLNSEMEADSSTTDFSSMLVETDDFPESVDEKEPLNSETASSDEPIPADEEHIGGDLNNCFAHHLLYHSFDIALIRYVGQENFEAWLDAAPVAGGSCGPKVRESVTIVHFIQHFGISQDVFESLVWRGLEDDEISAGTDPLIFTPDQIDALYSGDQAQINAAFCGPLAFVNEADGELYSIYWLADHSAEDYLEANLPMDQVEDMLTLAEELGYYPYFAALTQDAQDTLSCAIALEEELAAGGVSEAAE